MLTLALLLVGCVVVLVLLHEDPQWFKAIRAHQGSPAAGASGVTGSSGASGAARTPGRTTPTTTSPASSRPTSTISATAPVITSVSPASGAPGQKVTVSGRNFVSANHVITGYFGSAAAGTSCPTLGACVLTVPSGLKGDVQVTLHTESGVSNGEPFTVK